MIIELQELAVIDKNVMDIAKTGMSDPCEPGSIVVASETLAPSAPTFSISKELNSLVLTLTRPTTKTDGTALNSFREFAVYHSTSSGIDISNSGTYDGIIYSSATSVTHDCTVLTYFKVTALNTFSVESLPSAEDSDTPDGVSDLSPEIPTVATGLVFDGNPIIGDGIIGLLLLDPATTWGLFAHWEIQFALSTDSGSSWGAWTALTKTTKFGYLHKGISIAAGRRYKYQGRPVGTDGVGSTTWDTSDNSGDGWPNAGTWGSDNSAVVAETVLAENIIALNEVRAEHIETTTLSAISANLGTVTAGTINATVSISAAAIDTGLMSFARITPASVAIIAAMIGTDAVTNVKIQENAVRINELYVDGDINFGVSGSPKGIFGGDFMGRGTSKADKTKPHIQFDLDKMWIASGTASGNDVEFTSADQFIFTTLPTSDPSVAGAIWNSSGTVMISSG